MSLNTELDSLTNSLPGLVPPDVLATMDGALRRLNSSSVVGSALKRGARMPDFSLPDASGQLVDSTALRAKGPIVVSFYRGEWCPYCNLELKALQAKLPDIRHLGATLVAISPQLPDRSLSTREKLALEFPVLSDVGNRVARQFGLVFTLDPALKPIYENAFGIDVPAFNGDASYELPLAATYVVNRDGIVIDAYVDADYRKRLEPVTIMDWLGRAAQRA